MPVDHITVLVDEPAMFVNSVTVLVHTVFGFAQKFGLAIAVVIKVAHNVKWVKVVLVKAEGQRDLAVSELLLSENSLLSVLAGHNVAKSISQVPFLINLPSLLVNQVSLLIC